MEAKKKNIGLIVGFLLMLLLSYQFSIKKTFELKDKIEKLSKDKELLSNAEVKINRLQFQNQSLDSVLQSNDVSVDQSFEQNLVQKITKLKKLHKIELISYEKPHSFESEGAKMLSYSIEVKGDFRQLMLFTSALEKQRLGEFSSVGIEKKKNYRTGRNELFCKLVLQRLSK